MKANDLLGDEKKILLLGSLVIDAVDMLCATQIIPAALEDTEMCGDLWGEAVDWWKGKNRRSSCKIAVQLRLHASFTFGLLPSPV